MKLPAKTVRIHESTVACDWARAAMPKNHEKMKFRTFGHFRKFDILKIGTFLKILDILDIF